MWVLVNEKTVERTPKGWKIAILKTANFGADSRRELEKAFEGTPRQQKLRQLAIHEPLIRHIENANKVSVDIDDWYNKSLSRSVITVYVYDEHGKARVEMEWMQYWTRYSVKQIVEKIFS